MAARNVYGLGAYSTPAVSIAASEPPAQPLAPTTAIQGGSPTAVTISWSAPAANGDPLLYYNVTIVHIDGSTYSPAPATCNQAGGAPPATSCSVPLTALRAAPFALTLGTAVKAKVLAVNGQGAGAASQPSATTALVETEPAAV